MEKQSKTNFYSNELKSLHCNICNSNLIMKYLNHAQQIILCSNKNVRKIIYNINIIYFLVYVSIGFIRYGEIYI